jgi:hypothetical protein
MSNGMGNLSIADQSGQHPPSSKIQHPPSANMIQILPQAMGSGQQTGNSHPMRLSAKGSIFN